MINLIIITIVTLGYYTFHLLEDVIDSKKEATIRRLRIKAGESDQLANDLKEKEAWHLYNWIKVALFALLVSYLYSSITFTSLFLIIAIGAFRIVYFNPLIALSLGSTFFHLGEGKWEILFKGKEKLYYFLNLTLLIVCYILIILKIY